jgi:hypothetical protein
MASTNNPEELFPSPIPSPQLVSLMEVNLTPEEVKITDLLGWTHKFRSFVTRQRINQVRWFVVLIPFLTRLISAPGGFDVFEKIIEYLEVKELMLLAAATENLIMPFINSSSKIFNRLNTKLLDKVGKLKLCNANEIALNRQRITSFENGQDLLREFRLFKLPRFFHKIDDSTIFTHTFPHLVEFHPDRPIMAMVDQTRRLQILAYGGEERHTRGQIIFIEPQPLHSFFTFKALNWSPDGSYLLALEGPFNKLYENNLIKLHLCKLKKNFFFLSLSLLFFRQKMNEYIKK